MKKSTKILLVISIIILILGIAIAVFSYIYTGSTPKNTMPQSNVSDNNLVEEDDIVENTVSGGEEVSKTKDLEVDYTDFTAYGKDEEEIKLSDYKDQAVMVLFWDTENSDSVEMLKRVNEIYYEYEDKIKVLAINTKNETDAEVLNEVNVPIYYDKNGEIVKVLNITEYPAMIYINAQNEIVNAKTGLTTKDALQANFDILAENF